MNSDRDKETEALHPDSVDDNARDRPATDHPRTIINKDSVVRAPVSANAEHPLVHPTLYGFYAEKKTNPTGFLKSLKQTRVKGFASEDRDRVLQELDALDPFFQKTLGLAQKSFASGPSSPTYWCLEWIGVAVVRGSEPLRSSSLDQSRSAEDLLLEIFRILGPAPRDKKLARRALNQLVCAILWLSGIRALDFFRAAEILSSSLSIAKPSTLSNQVQSISLQQLPRLATNPRLLRSVFTFATPWVSRANAAHAESLRAGAALADLREDMRKLQTSLDESEHSKSQLREKVDIGARQIQELTDKIMGRQVTSKHELFEHCSRSRGFLEKLKTSYLSTALDAANLQPPSVTVIQERIELALESMEAEMERLRKEISNA